MPSLRGLTVHVTDNKGINLSEWGVQNLRHSRGQKVSAYVQSTTGVHFEVSVQPRIPYYDADHPCSESDSDIGHDEIDNRRIDVGRPFVSRGPGRRRSGSVDRTRPRKHNMKNGDLDGWLSSPVRSPRKLKKIPQYSFLATLYLDGRSTPERKIMIYTDPEDNDFVHPNGKVSFRHRWTQSNDGTTIEHGWVFRERSIETVFDRLLINSGSQVQLEDHHEDDIVEAMQTAGIGNEQDVGGGRSRVGQIVVEIKRVVLGQKTYDRHYRSKHLAGREDDNDLDFTTDITHKTGFSYMKTVQPSPLRVVEYHEYRPGEGLWATFQFFYRSAEQLQKFGFPGFHTPANTRRTMNTSMVNLTPLSISQPLSARSKRSKQDEGTFEENMKKGAFRDGAGYPKYDYGSEYRDASADDELEAEELNKYPSARLPFFIPKAPRVGPQRDLVIPGLPTLATAWTPEVVATIRDPKRAKETPQGGFSNHGRPSKFMNNTSSDEPKIKSRRHVPLPGLGESSTSPSTAQLPLSASMLPPAPKGSSPAPPLSKENVARFDKEKPRMSKIGAHDSDADEEDADDELNTESDLETRAGDDDFEYTANPEEDDEGHGHLRDQLRKVDIKKRKHAQDDEEEEVDQSSKKMASNRGGNHQGRGTVVAVLTKRKQENEHLGKRGKTVQ